MSQSERVARAFEQKLQSCEPPRSVHGQVACRFHYRDLGNNNARCVILGKPNALCPTYLEKIRSIEK